MEGRARPRAWGAAVCAFAVLAMALAAPGSAAAKTTRYSVAGGCYSLAPASGGSAPAIAASQRFKATRLGSYMLFGKAHDFLAADGGTVSRAGQPSPAADWRLARARGRTFTLSPASARGRVLSMNGSDLSLASRSGAGSAARFRLKRAAGCARFPEASLNVSGKPARGATPYGQVRGVLDGPHALDDLRVPGRELPLRPPVEPLRDTGRAARTARASRARRGPPPRCRTSSTTAPRSTPTTRPAGRSYRAWARTNLTYEGTYYRWVQRVWKSGLRMIVMPVNENRILCQLMTDRRNTCDEMATVRKGLHDIKQLQRYVDAQAGGPGKGFFQIVRNPFQARRVINSGKMAVVLEVEVSELFDCKGADPSSCDRSTIDKGLADLYRRGVRSSLLLNKFDNPLTGVRFDGGPIGALINAANRLSYGSFWSAKTCKGPEHDNTIDSFQPDASAFLARPAPAARSAGRNAADLSAGAPLQHPRADRPRAPHRAPNDGHGDDRQPRPHEPARRSTETLKLLEARHYSGVISPHGWMDPGNWPRIWKLGGMAFPGAGSAKGFVDAWRTYRPKRTPYYFGWGYGADLGGLATQGAPAAAGSPHA